MTSPARVEPFGDGAVLVTLGDVIDAQLNRRVHLLARQLDEAHGRSGPGPFRTAVPAYASLLVPFDPGALSAHEAAEHVHRLLERLGREAAEADLLPPRIIDLRVRYGGADGPDLDEVAARTGLEPAQVVEAHASVAYTCFFLGFMPGFGYLGPLPPELRLPRRQEPRTRVPAGSVAIAGSQTAIYPASTPGGWHLIGRTDAVLWDLRREPPALLAPGDRVRFVPVRG